MSIHVKTLTLIAVWWCSAYAMDISNIPQRLNFASNNVHPNALAHMMPVAVAIPLHQAPPSANVLRVLSPSPYQAREPLLIYTRRTPRLRKIPTRKPTKMIIRIKRHRVVRDK